MIIADNKSTDETYATVLSLLGRLGDDRIHAMRVERKGVGVALRTAWTHSTGQVLSYLDADLPFRLDNLKSVIDSAIQGSDMVLGSRYMKGGVYGTSSLRRFLSRAYVLWVNVLFHCGVTDNCGIRCVRRNAFFKMITYLENDDWFFGTEMLVFARNLAMIVQEVPVQCVNNTSRPSSVRLFHTILDFVRLSLTLRIRLSSGTIVPGGIPRRESG
jgi:glycosyltransferase involved in cell wall biosynthesis